MEGFPYQEEKRLCLVQMQLFLHIVDLWLGESRDKESLEYRLIIVGFYLNLILVEKVYLKHLKSNKLTVQVVWLLSKGGKRSGCRPHLCYFLNPVYCYACLHCLDSLC